MVKRCVSVVLMLIMLTGVLSFAACGNNKSFDKDSAVVTLPETNTTAVENDTEPTIFETTAIDFDDTNVYADENVETTTAETKQRPSIMVPDSTVIEPENDSGIDTDKNKVPYTVPNANGVLSGLKICLDPGHGKFAQGRQEAIGPGSSQTKKAFSTGTAGSYQSEGEFNLTMAYLIKPMLEQHGATVYMTRWDENSISNIERAQYANELGCDMVVRIHADGSTNTSLNGISVLIPGRNEFVTDDDLLTRSRECGDTILNAVLAKTGANNRGLKERTDLTGFNWSSVPCILIECGFMSNASDDKKLADPTYQTLLAQGITEGLVNYFTLN